MRWNPKNAARPPRTAYDWAKDIVLPIILAVIGGGIAITIGPQLSILILGGTQARSTEITSVTMPATTTFAPTIDVTPTPIIITATSSLVDTPPAIVPTLVSPVSNLSVATSFVPQSAGMGCTCLPASCGGVHVEAGTELPASSILEPEPANRGTLYVFFKKDIAPVSGVLWVYVDENNFPARRSCIQAQYGSFHYNNLQKSE